LAAKQNRPGLLYREPEMSVRIIREEFNAEYRAVLIDDKELFDDVRDYVQAVAPALADRVQYYDPSFEPLPLFERFHVAEHSLPGFWQSCKHGHAVSCSFAIKAEVKLQLPS
jgi:ribonuclease E